MKKQIIIAAALLSGMLLTAKNTLFIHKDGAVTYDKAIADVDSIKLGNGQAVFSVDKDGSSKKISLANIDSMTFANLEDVDADGNIYIIFRDGTTTVKNPYVNAGLSIKVGETTLTKMEEEAKGEVVTVESATSISGLTFHIQGRAVDGGLTMNSDKAFNLSLEDATINSTSRPAICINTKKAATFSLVGENILIDGEENEMKATLYSKSELIFDKSTGSLSVTGNKKHAIFTSDLFENNGAEILVIDAKSDALHCDDFVMNEGKFMVMESGGDCVEAEKTLTMNGGFLALVSSGEDNKALKSDSILTINGGTTSIAVSGAGAKGIKAKSLTINDGQIEIRTEGESVVLEGDNTVSTAIKAEEIEIAGGDIMLYVAEKASGAKGVHADGNLNITGGKLDVTMNNLFSIYTNASNKQDTTMVSAIKGEKNINILGGNITLTTTSNGKGINGSGSESVVTIGAKDGKDDDLTLNITTTPNTNYYTTESGEDGTRVKFVGNPKGVYCSDGKIVFNAGTTTINSYANGVHAYITEINGGVVDITAQTDFKVASSSNTGGFGRPGQSSSSNNGTKYKGFRGDTLVNINGGYLVVRAAYEGIEGFRITANGGITEVSSDDDGWNATDSHLKSKALTSSSTTTNPWGGGRPGSGGFGGASSSTGYLTVNGGAHYVYAGGDGMDSNGSEYYTGGLVICNQNGSGGNGIFDKGDGSDAVLTATNDAVILGIGTKDMSENFTTSLNNTGYQTISASNGTMVYVKSGNTVLLAVKVQAASSINAGVFVNSKYSNCSISTSGSASELNYFGKTSGENIVYINPELYK